MQEKHMHRSDFAFDLPKELIAQHPLDSRDHSRPVSYTHLRAHETF